MCGVVMLGIGVEYVLKMISSYAIVYVRYRVLTLLTGIF